MVDRSGDPAWGAALERPHGLVRGAGSSTFASRLDRWVAEARVDEAALRRSRERWLREVAEQEATFSGVLVDLLERRAPTVVHLRGGRRHHGQIRAVAVDFLALGPPSGGDVLVAMSAITALRTAPAVEPTMGDRVVATDLRLVDVLAELSVDRARVVAVTGDGGEVVAGQLRSVGVDVAVVRTDADPPSVAYLPVAAISELTFT